MKTVGLITEYNPFHNGHLYHIEKAKELTGADRVIVIMSGDYVQRGTPAVLSKHSRAHMALLNGASVVLELPVCYSCASAEFFAKGAVSVLDGLGCIDALCFGSECGNLEHLTSIAHLLSAEPETYRHHLQSSLKNGMSFPAARCHALKKMTGDAYASQILSDPNNILGIEYLKALKKLNSPIVPFTLKREFSGYHDTELHDCSSSASAIRKVLMNIPSSPYLSKYYTRIICFCCSLVNGMPNLSEITLSYRSEAKEVWFNIREASGDKRDADLPSLVMIGMEA